MAGLMFGYGLKIPQSKRIKALLLDVQFQFWQPHIKNHLAAEALLQEAADHQEEAQEAVPLLEVQKLPALPI